MNSPLRRQDARPPKCLIYPLAAIVAVIAGGPYGIGQILPPTPPVTGPPQAIGIAEQKSDSDAGAANIGKLDALLRIAPVTLNVQEKSKEVLAHSRAVMSYYRTCITAIQKVGEPSDAVYREESIINAKRVSSYAFQASAAAAILITEYARQQPAAAAAKEAPSEALRMQIALAAISEQTRILQGKQQVLKEQASSARGDDLQAIRRQLDQVQGELELKMAMGDALRKISVMPDTGGQAGLAGDLERLKQMAPGMTDISAKVIPAALTPLHGARSDGIISQATIVFQLLAAGQAISQLAGDTEELRRQAIALRTPLANVLSGMLQQAEDLVPPRKPDASPLPATSEAPKANAGSNQNAVQTPGRQLDSITAMVKIISTVAVPLSEEIIALEQSRANLLAWQAAVDIEYHDALRSLLERMLVIVIALVFILSAGEIWRRFTIRYIREVRRRRQLLGMRRLVIYFLGGLVLLFGFITRFDSLATFAGFITAGLAVSLQTILLSVAAYFFIVGRYGIRVGDRVTIVDVTGDVIEVGLVRFYLMELAVSGLGLQPTGRVAVFSNAILFQPGTPLYKQMPGTDYEWQEMTAILKKTGDYTHAAQVLLGGVQHVYDSYKDRIEQQHQELQSAMDTAMNAPRIESRVQFVDGGLQFVVRFPVEILNASDVTQQITEAMQLLIQSDKTLQDAVLEQPVVKPAAKG